MPQPLWSPDSEYLVLSFCQILLCPATATFFKLQNKNSIIRATKMGKTVSFIMLIS